MRESGSHRRWYLYWQNTGAAGVLPVQNSVLPVLVLAIAKVWCTSSIGLPVLAEGIMCAERATFLLDSAGLGQGGGRAATEMTGRWIRPGRGLELQALAHTVSYFPSSA